VITAAQTACGPRAPAADSAASVVGVGGFRRAEVVELAPLRASGASQMTFDTRLLHDGGPVGAAGEGVPTVWVRRYTWLPPAVSIGKFQQLSDEAHGLLLDAGVDVTRRPTGGRLVLHGSGFEWSFAVLVPAGVLPPYRTDAPYRLVSEALAQALAGCGVALDETREEPYTRSALCFASALRHDLLVGGTKAVAVAQARHGDRILVHGSVLERRPPGELVAAVEAATGEGWRGEGLDARGFVPDAGAVWDGLVTGLRAALGAAEGRDGAI
jgi:lipoate-protein ligase A